MFRPAILCADDYALTPGISRAIVDLAGRRRLSAISCMTTSALWPDHAGWLKPHIGKVDIGLHITLVDERPLTAMPLTAPHGRLPGITSMLLRAHARRLDRAEIRREITAQWDAFETAMGRPPDHIDGHLHTHVLPVIRDIVLEMAVRRAPKAWLRNISEPLPRVVRRGIAPGKAGLLSVLGAVFARHAAGRPMNDGFSGIYGLHGGEDIAALFGRFMASAARFPVVMCHPGDCAGEDEAIAAARSNEYQFLSSAAFETLLARLNIRLGRYADIANHYSGNIAR